MRRAWTIKETCFLTDNYESLSYSAIGKILKRSQPSICCKTKRLGITTSTSRRKRLVGQRYGRLVALKRIGKDKNQQCRWLCKCDCGNTTEISTGNWGRTKSCGCLSIETHRKDLSGHTFGRLSVIEYSHTKDNAAFWKCQCGCEASVVVKSSYLLCGDTKSCGNCNEFANSKLISHPQREIAKMVNGALNYQVGTRYIDVALPAEKIAVEYHGWYWHKDRKREDIKRIKELTDDGWKVIIVKGRKGIPKKETLVALVIQAYLGTPYQELKLSDWLGYN